MQTETWGQKLGVGDGVVQMSAESRVWKGRFRQRMAGRAVG